SVSEKVKSIEEFYKKFEILRGQIDDEEDGLESVFESAKQLKEEIENLKQTSSNNLEAINSIVTSVSEKVKSIEEFYKKFEILRGQIDDEEDGLESVFESAKQLKEAINSIKKESDQVLINLKVTEQAITEIKKQSEKEKLSICSLKEESFSFRDSIQEQLELITPSILRNAFKERKIEILKALNFWKWFLVGSLLILVIGVLVIYAVQSESPDGFKDWKQWYRYLFLSPIIYLVFLSSKNYNLERDLLEKYSYKSVISTTLPAHIKLFETYFPKNLDQKINFAVASMDKIYKEPFLEKDRKRKYGIGINKIFNINFEDDEVSLLAKKDKEALTRAKDIIKENIPISEQKTP
ncbi:MAG: hypothetical protein WC459_03635, partial [Patescibacteria group bacterium]